MRAVKLTRHEKVTEDALLKGEYVPVSNNEFTAIAAALASRKKDAVLNIRVNSDDLRNIKDKAHKLGLRYQTFIAEILHRAAQT